MGTTLDASTKLGCRSPSIPATSNRGGLIWTERYKFNFQGGVIMIMLRGIGVFIFLALLTGGAAYSAVSQSGETQQCPPPGALAATSCYYKLTITHIDRKSGLVKGKVPRTVVEENKRDNPDLDITKYRFDEYSFKVKDLETLKVGSDYEFDSVPNTNELKIRK